jgi:hypothetical protein
VYVKKFKKTNFIKQATKQATGADWPYNEVGKIPRGPSSLEAPKINGNPPSMTFFFFLVSTSVWTGAFALFSSYLLPFLLLAKTLALLF